jgi:DNA-binding response OmpR family regulator
MMSASVNMTEQVKNTTGRILVIDDDPDIRMMVERLLVKEGYEVKTASRRDEALEQLAVFQPSLILLDVLLSGNDGRDICRQIKSDPLSSHIRVIMVSAHPSASEKFQDYGADGFVGKPFSSAALLQKVQGIGSL